MKEQPFLISLFLFVLGIFNLNELFFLVIKVPFVLIFFFFFPIFEYQCLFYLVMRSLSKLLGKIFRLGDLALY